MGGSDNRYLVFQNLEHTLILRRSNGCYFQAHRKRNLAEYEGDLDVTEGFVDEFDRACGTVTVAAMHGMSNRHDPLFLPLQLQRPFIQGVFLAARDLRRQIRRLLDAAFGQVGC